MLHANLQEHSYLCSSLIVFCYVLCSQYLCFSSDSITASDAKFVSSSSYQSPSNVERIKGRVAFDENTAANADEAKINLRSLNDICC